MSLPVKEKTWLYTVNQTVGSISSALADNQDYLFKLKQALIGFGTNPWTVWGSSDGTDYDAGGGTDYWGASTDLVFAGGTDHSWIVLKQTGVNANFSICIDLSIVTNYQFVLSFSPAAGFTGGTLSTAPTATDQITLKSGNGHGGSNSSWTGKLHVWQSNDGECTRWVLMRGGTLRAIAIFDKPKAALAAWTNPSMGAFQGTYSASGYASYSNFNDNSYVKGRIASEFGMYMTCEGWVSAAGGERLSMPDDDTGEWPIMPIGLASDTAGHRGAHKGAVYDLWWGSTALANADTFPADVSKQFAVFDDMVFPWNGSTPLIS